jgi:hypothetical protein
MIFVWVPFKIALKMAVVTKNRNFFNCPLLLYYESNFNSSYIVISSLTYILGFSVKYIFQWIYTNFVYFEKKNHLKTVCSEIWTVQIIDPRWLPLLWAEFSNGKKKKNQLKFFYTT